MGKTLALIASPPRSASSAISRLVEAHGFSLGNNKTTVKNRFNERGYFENTLLLRLHEKAINGQIWDPRDRSDDLDINALARELFTILRDDFPETHISIKDPRVFQIPWIYVQALKKLELEDGPVDVKIIHLWRSREATVGSLTKFGRIFANKPEAAGRVWDGYHERIEKAVGVFRQNLNTQVLLLPLIALATRPDYVAQLVGDFLGRANAGAGQTFEGGLLHNGS